MESVSQASLGSTSAAGGMLRQFGGPILVGVMLAGTPTSSAYAASAEASLRSPRPIEQTNAGAAIESAKPAGPAIAELRRLSGLNWDQLASLFDVNRRSLHFWASGKAMNTRNEEHLQRMLAVVRKADRGSASANRTALLAVAADGSTPVALLAQRKYEQVSTRLGIGSARQVQAPKPSAELLAARAPPPPDQLVEALQDPIHRGTGIYRAAKSTRTRSGR